MTTLSIGMIVKNESEKLEATLQALQPLRDKIRCQLIIADTGSDDNTLEIAEKYGDDVFTIPWENSFGKARNATLAKAKGRWFFFLDADEVLTDSEELVQFFRNPKNQRYHTVKIKIRNMTSYQREIWQDSWSSRIFRIRPDARFQNDIHEFYPTQEPIFTLNKTFLLHSGYNNDDTEFMNAKMNRNIQIIEASLQEDLNDWQRVKLLIEYGDSMSLTDDPDGVGYEKVRQAIDILQTLPADDERRVYLTGRAYSLAIRMRYNQGQQEDCIAIGDEYFTRQPTRCPGDIDIHYVLGEVHWQKDDTEKCRYHLEQYLYQLQQDQDMMTAGKYMVIATASLEDKMRCYLAQIYQKLNLPDEAWQCAMQIKRETFGGVDLRQFKWQLAINEDSEHRLPELWSSFNDELQTALLDGIARALPKANDERRQDILRGLQALPDHSDQATHIIRLWSDNVAEVLALLEQESDCIFPAEEGVILYQCYYHHIPMDKLLPHLQPEWIEKYLNVSAAIHPSMPYYTYKYYEEADLDDLSLAELHLAQYSLCHNTFCVQFDQVLLAKIWPLTLRYAYTFMQRIYTDESMNTGNRQILYPLEQFILWAWEGETYRQRGEYSQCLSCYRQGLSVYPQGKDVVDMIVVQIEDLLDPAAAEMKKLAQTLKQQIRDMIDNGDLDSANALAEELTTIIPDDEEVKFLLEETRPTDFVWM